MAVAPLAGLDPSELVDPRPIAEAIREAVTSHVPPLVLAPKLAITVDGGGRFHLGAVTADVRLTAVDDEHLLLAVGGELGFPDGPAALLSRATGADMSLCRAALAGSLELSGGVGDMAGMGPDPLHLALGSFLLGWGGLCVHFQAAAVTAGTGMRLSRRLRGKLCHGLLSAVLTFFLSMLLI